jgi:hypothetical protein
MSLTTVAGTKAAKKVPANFDQVKTTFLSSINKMREEYGIPPNLVINWDQTGIVLFFHSN